MSKYQVAVTDNGLQFLTETKGGKLQAVQGDFAFVEPMPTEGAVQKLKGDVAQRENVTRAALSCIIQILDTPRTDGYKGKGDINKDTGIVKELKAALRGAEEAFFTPMFKKSTELDTFLTGLREAGIYATVKGVALKYFYFVGKLPCLYEGDKPNKDKLLSVAAMQKIMANMVEDKEETTLSSKVMLLHAAFKGDSLDVRGLDNLLYVLGAFAQDVREARNTIVANQTDALDAQAAAQQISAQMPLSKSQEELDSAIAAELARLDMEAREEALM